MRVACTSIPELPGAAGFENPWLTVGAEYAVLEISARPGGPIELHLPTNSPGDLGWFPSTSFVIVDDSVPAIWVTQIDDLGNVQVGPMAWLAPGFWERFYDGEETAVEIARVELAALSGGVRLWARKSWVDR